MIPHPTGKLRGNSATAPGEVPLGRCPWEGQYLPHFISTCVSSDLWDLPQLKDSGSHEVHTWADHAELGQQMPRWHLPSIRASLNAS